MYYNSKIYLCVTICATSSGPVVWLTWLENIRQLCVVKLYPCLRGNRPFILPEFLSISKWENGKITLWWKEPLNKLGRQRALKMPKYLSVYWHVLTLFIQGMVGDCACSFKPLFSNSGTGYFKACSSVAQICHNELTSPEKHGLVLPEIRGYFW